MNVVCIAEAPKPVEAAKPVEAVKPVEAPKAGRCLHITPVLKRSDSVESGDERVVGNEGCLTDMHAHFLVPLAVQRLLSPWRP